MLSAFLIAGLLCFHTSPTRQLEANLATFYFAGEQPDLIKRHDKGTIATVSSWHLKKGWGLGEQAPDFLGFAPFRREGSRSGTVLLGDFPPFERFQHLKDGWLILEPFYVETCIVDLRVGVRRVDEQLQVEEERREMPEVRDDY